VSGAWLAVVFGADLQDCQRWATEHEGELAGARRLYMPAGKKPPALPPGVHAVSHMTEAYQAAPDVEVLEWINENAPPVPPVERVLVVGEIELAVTHLDVRLFADYSGADPPVASGSEFRVYGNFRVSGREVHFFGGGLSVLWNSDSDVPQVRVHEPVVYLERNGESDGEQEGGRGGGSFVGGRRGRGGGAVADG
jgi:hypothetical protein